MSRNERLRQQRIQRNWRQQDLADQLQTSLVTVQRWERGTQQPRAYYRAKLCALFDTSAEALGLFGEDSVEDTVAEQGQVQAPALARAATLWTVPYARNLHFTGRDELLDQLMQQLTPVVADRSTSIRRAALTQSQIIKGLGGIGKTQIAVEYAYRAHEQGRYTHILWIAAASEETILSSFGALAELLPAFPTPDESDQRKLVAAIIRWLEQCEHPWLLIFDNADDLSLVQPYLPHRGNGSILLTTRASAVGSFASSSLEVDTMGMLEGTQLLLRRAQRFADASDEEIDEAGNLVVTLGQFPLALDQAGAYIEETRCSVSDYLHLYEQHRQGLLTRRGRQATGYPDSVATTWSLAFQQVEQANPASAELLCLCALLAPDHIPEELLTEGAPYWPPALQQAVATTLSFNQALEPLLAFSLVKRLAEDRLLSIHRLVQVVQMDTMTREVQRQWAQRVVRAVNAVFPRDPADAPATWPQCLRYLEQAQAGDLLIQQYDLLLPEAGELLDHTATYLRERALYTLAEPLYQRAVHIREHLFGPEHLHVALSLSGLATLYWSQGKYEDSITLHQRALRIREQQLESYHPLVSASRNNVALLYCEQGKYEEAEQLHRQILHEREQQLGAEHIDVAESLNNLASIFFRCNRYGEAEQFQVRALHIREQQLGMDHPLVAASLNNLALNYSKQGKYAQAEPLYQRALGIWGELLGPENPTTAYALYGLAFLYYQLGKYGEAEPLYQRTLRIREQQLGLHHPRIANLLKDMAELYRAQKHYAQAEPLYQRALHIREQQLGAEHLETAALLYDFAGLQQAQGRTSEAIHMYQRALTIREHALGSDHALTIDTRNCLHAIQAMLGPIQS